MPNIKAKVKSLRQERKARVRNRGDLSEMRTKVKHTLSAIDANDTQKASENLHAAIKKVGKNRKKGIIHPNKAARMESRLTRRVNALAAGSEQTPETEA